MFEEEVFEITDFTTSSDWERFVSNLEEIIRQWDLCWKQDENESKLSDVSTNSHTYSHGKWSVKHETIKFSKIMFNIAYHYLEESCDAKPKLTAHQSGMNVNLEDHQSIPTPMACNDMMNKRNDFPSRSHCLVRWYGLRSFIILTSADPKELITTEDRAKLLLSSACIALYNTNCSVPLFFQLHQIQRKYYHGICQNDSIRVHYDMIHFSSVPAPYRFVSQLLNLFKEKVSTPMCEMPPVLLSIRFTHSLKQWPNGWLHNELCDAKSTLFENESIDVTDVPHLELLWHCSDEPIQELQLATTWPTLSEEVIVDSPVHSDLDPLNAPLWSLRVIFKDDLQCAVSEALNILLSLKKSWAKNDQILGKLLAESNAHDNEIEIKQALNRLTNPSPLSVSLPQFHSKFTWNRPTWIKEQCLNFIFNINSENKSSDDKQVNDTIKKEIKSAPRNSLTWRIALTLCNIHYKYKELSDVTYMWKEIICELRNHWENKIVLPHLEIGSPDLGTSILHQKLQMLNCCIEQKLKRESKQNEVKVIINKDANGDSDDEFFDCPEQLMDDDISSKPEGRLKQCGELKLLNCDTPLYIPITQDSPPMTEDMLHEHSLILSKLGTTAESASLRAKMQCSSLLSDMEAFKAANPNAVIEDFIRWHSPRDWIASDDNSNNGYLSSRMQNPGNIWHEVWASAEPNPVHRQKRLFDYTKEAEKVLHYFASLTVTEFIDLLMPVLINCAVLQITAKISELNICETEISFDINAIIDTSERNEFDKSIDFILENEMKINQFQSLLRKFEIANELETDPKLSANYTKDIRQLVVKLLTEPEVEFSSYSHFGKLMKRMFSESQIAIYETNNTVGERDFDEHRQRLSQLPFPIAKEFIFRLSLPRPNSYSRVVPQRMYCLLSSGEFRIAGAFSEDTTYI